MFSHCLLRLKAFYRNFDAGSVDVVLMSKSNTLAAPCGCCERSEAIPRGFWPIGWLIAGGCFVAALLAISDFVAALLAISDFVAVFIPTKGGGLHPSRTVHPEARGCRAGLPPPSSRIPGLSFIDVLVASAK